MGLQDEVDYELTIPTNSETFVHIFSNITYFSN